MLSIKNLHVAYGKVRVLKGLVLEVAQGEIVAIIGANGAGKTTTLMAISGVLPKISGDILFCGENITSLAPHQVVGRGICHVPEGRRIFPQLSVLENLEMGAYLQTDAGLRQEDLESTFRLFPRLKERRNQRGGSLSGGEQQMLAIGRALMGRPKLLLLDEPSLGLAPLMVEKIFELIAKISREGTTILLVEQNAHAALNLSHRGYVMETGQITLEGRADALLQDNAIQSAYLGGPVLSESSS